jgi:hypothetical protein
VKRLAASSQSRVRAWLRFVAALALALFAGDHVLPALHYGLVAHELCPEHGRLEHTSDRAQSRARHDAGPAYAAGGDEHHEHCGSVPASPPRAPVSGETALVFNLAPAAREESALPSTAVLTADVVAFAPKQSPPA